MTGGAKTSVAVRAEAMPSAELQCPRVELHRGGAESGGPERCRSETERDSGVVRGDGAERRRKAPERSGVSPHDARIPRSERRHRGGPALGAPEQATRHEGSASQQRVSPEQSNANEVCVPPVRVPEIGAATRMPWIFGRAPARVTRMLGICLGRQLVCSNWRALDSERRLTT